MTLGSGVTSTKSPGNTDECCLKQSLVAEVKAMEAKSYSEYDLENIEKRQIIDVDPTATVVNTTIHREESVDPEEEKRLFHSEMWVKGTPLHLFVDNDSHNNLILVKSVK
jgi:hypothetical protein